MATVGSDEGAGGAAPTVTVPVSSVDNLFKDVDFSTIRDIGTALQFSKLTEEQWHEIKVKLGEPLLDDFMAIAMIGDEDYIKAGADNLNAIGKARLNIFVNLLRKKTGIPRLHTLSQSNRGVWSSRFADLRR